MQRSIRIMTRRAIMIGIIAPTIVGSVASARDEPTTEAKRNITPDDFIRMVTVDDGSVSWSPDGEYLAYNVRRTTESGSATKDYYVNGNAGDLWLVDTRTGRRRVVADGSYWKPEWSPDSKHLLFKSTRGQNLMLWAWHRETDTVEQLTDRAIDDQYENFHQFNPCLWLSAHNVLCSVYELGEIPLGPGTERFRGPVYAMRSWEAGWKHEPEGISVLNSGLELDRPRGVHHGAGLQLIDVLTGERQMFWGRDAHNPSLSPRGEYIAVRERVPDLISAQAILQHPDDYTYSEPNRLVVMDRTGKVIFASAPAIFVEHSDVVWAPDETKLAFLNSPEQRTRHYGTSASVDEEICIVDLTTGNEQKVHAPTETVLESLDWRSGVLLVRSHKARIRHWFVVHGDGALVEVANESPAATVSDWYLEPGRKSFVGVADDAVWLLDPVTATVQKRPVSELQSIVDVVAPGQTADDESVPSKLILKGVSSKGTSGWYEYNLGNQTIAGLDVPSRDASLLSCSQQARTCLFREIDQRNCFSIWLVPADGTGKTITLYSDENKFMRNVALGQGATVRYQTLEGTSAGGQITLPPGYVSGRHYPMVVIPYPGSVYAAPKEPVRWDSADASSIGMAYILNPQLLASLGYVVLKPSVPLPKTDREGQNPEPYLYLLNGIMPAVDKMIDLGIADPDKIALFGHSFGGYAVFALITQTHRFKAAISLAGALDGDGTYGTFVATSRFTDDLPSWSSMIWSEATQGGLNGPPWEYPEHYIRNNPIFYADRITTPLLILQGDQDFAPIGDGEQMFTALSRLDRRAQFARYWTGDHFLVDPVIVKDALHRVDSWLKENMQTAPPVVTPDAAP